jgi:DNA repair protein RadC
MRSPGEEGAVVVAQASDPIVPDAPEPPVCPHCAGEGARRYRPGAPEDRPEITSPEAAAAVLLPVLDGLDREHCLTLNLDTKHRLVATTTVSVGSVDHTFMSPREVFRDALLHGASALVIAHNHPSGDAEPSRDDQLITRRLVRAGELVGVELLDHLVIGHERWVSLARRGALTDESAAAADFQLDAADVRRPGRDHSRRGL